MSIGNGNSISATDINTIINSIQNTYKRYGWSGTASTVSSDIIASAATLNTAINKLNSCISDSADRRYYYYKGSTVATVSAGALLSASSINSLGTTNSNVYNDYCSCNSNCCVGDCCDWDCNCDSVCSCDRDCCECECGYNTDCCDKHGDCMDCSCHYDCGCDSNCNCDSNCCDSDCCVSN